MKHRLMKHCRVTIFVMLALALACDDSHTIIEPPDPEPQTEPRSEAELIQALQRAYQEGNVGVFAYLLPNAEQAEFSFILNEPDPDDGSTSWGRTVELILHQRMFRPEDTPVDVQVPRELWLNEMSITLTPVSAFEERTDLYTPQGVLDPAHWRATEAEYHAVLFFGTQGEADYTVDGRAHFIIINDLAKATGDSRKYLIYRWEDLGDFLAVAGAVNERSWSRVKSFYRN